MCISKITTTHHLYLYPIVFQFSAQRKVAHLLSDRTYGIFCNNGLFNQCGGLLLYCIGFHCIRADTKASIIQLVSPKICIEPK